MSTAKTRAFRDEHGNRFIVPSFVLYPGSDRKQKSGTDVISEAFLFSLALRTVKVDDDWFEFDPNNFHHIRTVAAHPAFLHGGATVLLFDGPEFQKLKKDQP